MFTGIVTDVGRVSAIEQRGDRQFTIATRYDVDDIDLGASISCSGACLTVVAKGRDENGEGWFQVDASAETLSCTSLDQWVAGTAVNLERALRVGDELGGHIVSGHVDCIGTITTIADEGDSKRIAFAVPSNVMRYIAPKGSITIEGVSLTVNGVSNSGFDINVIPHTQSVTTFGGLVEAQQVNIEVDSLARYVDRLLKFSETPSQAGA
ncbi:MAG: riboflavin synthase [Alphaproteobacteria bacterium]